MNLNNEYTMMEGQLIRNKKKQTKFDEKEYNKKYKKENKLQFKVDLNIEDKIALDKMLKKMNMTKSEFLKKSISKFKEENNIKIDHNDAINFLNRVRGKVKYEDWFDEYFCLGNYCYQDQDEGGEFLFSDDHMGTFIVSKDHDYVLFEVWTDKEGNEYDGDYITYKDYSEFMSKYRKDLEKTD